MDRDELSHLLNIHKALTNWDELKSRGHSEVILLPLALSHIISSAQMNMKNPDWADFQLSLHLHYTQSGEGQDLLGEKVFRWFPWQLASSHLREVMQPTHCKALCRVGLCNERRISTPTRFKRL